MSFSGLIAMLALAAAAVFAAFNQPLLLEPRAVVVPGGTYTIPLIGVLLAAAGTAIILMLLGEAGAAAMWRASTAKLSRRIYERDREMVELKSGTHAGVERRIEEVRLELSEQIEALARLLESRLPARTSVHDTLREDADHERIRREMTVTRRG